MPRNEPTTPFVNSRLRPWSVSGYRHVVFDLRNKLAEEGKLRRELTLHGLRTTFGQAAAELGIDERKIADGMDHADVKTTRGYVREAGRERDIKEVVQLVSARMGRTK